MKPILEKSRRIGLPWVSQWISLGLLVSVTVGLTVVLYPKILQEKHVYRIGDVAEKNIKATRDFFIEDRKATEAKRAEAVESVLTVYDHDTTLLPGIVQRINRAFDEVRAVFEKDLAERIETSFDPLDGTDTTEEERARKLSRAVEAKREAFEALLGIDVGDGAYRLLENEGFSRKTESLIVRILSEVLENGVVANKEVLLRDFEKGIILRRIGTRTESPLDKPRRLYGLDQSKAMVRIIGQPLLEDVQYKPAQSHRRPGPAADSAQHQPQPKRNRRTQATGCRGGQADPLPDQGRRDDSARG